MRIQLSGGPLSGQMHEVADPPYELHFELNGWRHLYRSTGITDKTLSSAVPTEDVTQYRYISGQFLINEPTGSPQAPGDAGETERPMDIRERIRARAMEDWRPTGTISPGDVPGGRVTNDE